MSENSIQPNELKFEIAPDFPAKSGFKVIGVGGGGSCVVERMLKDKIEGVDFCVMDTDLQHLQQSHAPHTVRLGKKLLGGLGTGSNPALGKEAALEETQEILDFIGDSRMVFIAAGLGGGTGTGAAPVVASLAREIGALAVAVVTKPFDFEGLLCRQRAERGLTELVKSADTVIAISNQKLLETLPKGTPFLEALSTAADVLRQAIQCVAEFILVPGVINRDFSNVRAVMQNGGLAMMGTAIASGPSAAVEAARQAITSPFIDEGGITGARGLLVNITASSQLGLHDVSQACDLIREATGRKDVEFTFGLVLNESMSDSVKVTVIATGFDRAQNHSSETVQETRQEPRSEPSHPQPAEPLVLTMPRSEDLMQEDDVDIPAYLRKGKLF